jgi:hypothetical protein
VCSCHGYKICAQIYLSVNCCKKNIDKGQESIY